MVGSNYDLYILICMSINNIRFIKHFLYFSSRSSGLHWWSFFKTNLLMFVIFQIFVARVLKFLFEVSRYKLSGSSRKVFCHSIGIKADFVKNQIIYCYWQRFILILWVIDYQPQIFYWLLDQLFDLLWS